MSITIRGASAEVHWGYHVAATLGSWTLTDGVLDAQVVDVDSFRVSQSPLVWVVGSLRRPLDGLQIAGSALTARCRPLEVSDAALSDRHA